MLLEWKLHEIDKPFKFCQFLSHIDFVYVKFNYHSNKMKISKENGERLKVRNS